MIFQSIIGISDFDLLGKAFDVWKLMYDTSLYIVVALMQDIIYTFL